MKFILIRLLYYIILCWIVLYDLYQLLLLYPPVNHLVPYTFDVTCSSCYLSVIHFCSVLFCSVHWKQNKTQYTSTSILGKRQRQTAVI